MGDSKSYTQTGGGWIKPQVQAASISASSGGNMNFGLQANHGSNVNTRHQGDIGLVNKGNISNFNTGNQGNLTGNIVSGGDANSGTQVTHDLQQETLESSESPITRALLFDDSPGKSEISVSSTLSFKLTFRGSCCNEISDVDDNASVWSIQVNASSQGDVEDPKEVMGEVEDYEEEELGEVEDGGLIDGLCAGMEKVCVQEKGGTAKFKGRHTRFIYNSDDEIEGEEEAIADSSVSPSALCLKGVPMPEGKHLRFLEEDEDQEKVEIFTHQDSF